MLALRRPRWVFGFAGVLTLLITALIITAWAATGFRMVDVVAMQGLVWPVAIGCGLAAGLIQGRLRRGVIASYRAAALRCVMALSAAGFAWPFSFGVATLLQGDWRAFVASLPIALAGALIGALAGGVGGAAAGAVALTRR